MEFEGRVGIWVGSECTGDASKTSAKCQRPLKSGFAKEGFCRHDFIKCVCALKTHTPQIWEVEIHTPNLGGESSKKSACFTEFPGAHSLNLGGMGSQSVCVC